MLLEALKTPRDFAPSCIKVAPRLATIAMTVSGSKADADDIVQQAFTIALEKDSTFESEAQFIGWLAGIVRNCALNHRRKLGRRKTYATDPFEMRPEASTPSKDSINNTTGELKPEQTAFDDRVKLALLSLSEKARCCLLLRTVNELSYKEISELMDIPEGTAMNLVHRSKNQLRELLTTDLGSNSSTETKV